MLEEWISVPCVWEEVRNRAAQDSHGASTYIWLVLAGGFSNLPALRLYIAQGFGDHWFLQS